MKISEYNETIGFFSSILMVTKFECDIGTNPCAEIELPIESAVPIEYTVELGTPLSVFFSEEVLKKLPEEYIPLSWYFEKRFRSINPMSGFITDVGV